MELLTLDSRDRGFRIERLPRDSLWLSRHLSFGLALAESMGDRYSADDELRAYQRGDVFSLELIRHARGLVHLQGVCIDEAATKGLLDVVKIVLEHAGATYTTQAIDGAAANGHLEVVQYLDENFHTGFTADATDSAAEYGHWDVVDYLLSRTGQDEWEVLDMGTEQPQMPRYTHRVMDAAALDGRLDLVARFHREGLPCSSAAMDFAAERGCLEIVQFLHKYRNEGCTNLAMDRAAEGGHFEVVKFLHENRSEGCTTNAMDSAAARGDLELVRFLHNYRREGCTTQAVDSAAGNGHDDVVGFLLEHRTEGFTCLGVAAAAKQGCTKEQRNEMFRSESWKLIGDHRHVRILQWMYRARPDLFDPAIMPSLLLCGAFDVWLEMKQAFPECGGEEEAMMVAGERGRMSTIRFLLEVQGRADLTYFMFAGAKQERPSWIVALHRFDPDGGFHYDHFFAEEDERARTEWWRPTSFFLENGIPDWMIEQSLIDYQLQKLGIPGDQYSCKWTWPIWAIYRHDVATLEVLLQLERTSEFMSDPRFSFEKARSHAIRVGRLDILQWLFANTPHIAVEPNLLDDAIFYRQLNIAKWLAYNYPEACEDFPGIRAWPLAPLGVPLDMSLLDELERDKRLRVLVDFGAMAAYAAEQGNLPLLQRLYSRYPASVLARRDILDRTIALNCACCDLQIVKYLHQTGYSHVSTLAMDSITIDSQLPLLRFLFKHYRHGDCTLGGLLDAAAAGSVNIVLFHLREGGMTNDERELLKEFVADKDDEWVVALRELLLAQEENDDRLLKAEWLSDSETSDF